MTQFTFTEIKLWDDLSFWIDGNSKITAGNGTYDEPAANAFSLPHITCCPNSTPECRAACYVHGLAANAQETYAKYGLNAMALHRVLLSNATQEKAAKTLGIWIRMNCQGGFRWHVSGDVMHERHAKWIRRVAHHAWTAPMWIYTRTLTAVPILVKADNLTVNVSADSYNYVAARDMARLHGARVCYLTRDGSVPDDLPEGSVIFPDYSLRGRNLAEPTTAPWWQSLSQENRKKVCGADFFGQSENMRCAVDRCSKCLLKP